MVQDTAYNAVYCRMGPYMAAYSQLGMCSPCCQFVLRALHPMELARRSLLCQICAADQHSTVTLWFRT